MTETPRSSSSWMPSGPRLASGVNADVPRSLLTPVHPRAAAGRTRCLPRRFQDRIGLPARRDRSAGRSRRPPIAAREAGPGPSAPRLRPFATGSWLRADGLRQRNRRRRKGLRRAGSDQSPRSGRRSATGSCRGSLREAQLSAWLSRTVALPRPAPRSDAEGRLRLGPGHVWFVVRRPHYRAPGLPAGRRFRRGLGKGTSRLGLGEAGRADRRRPRRRPDSSPSGRCVAGRARSKIRALCSKSTSMRRTVAPVRAHMASAAASARACSGVTVSLTTTSAPAAVVHPKTSERNPPSRRLPPSRCHLRLQMLSRDEASTPSIFPLAQQHMS